MANMAKDLVTSNQWDEKILNPLVPAQSNLRWRR